jgi:hypothetical protein
MAHGLEIQEEVIKGPIEAWRHPALLFASRMSRWDMKALSHAPKS